MPPKPRLLLCDAVAIIAAHEFSVWSQLCSAYEILVPSIVIEECSFFRDEQNRRVEIELRHQVQEGLIREYEASTSEFAKTAAMLHPDLRARVDEGEREAITYLRDSNADDVWFVTADGGAIEAAVAFDRSECAQSLETVLRRMGITRKLPRHHTEILLRSIGG